MTEEDNKKEEITIEEIKISEEEFLNSIFQDAINEAGCNRKSFGR